MTDKEFKRLTRSQLIDIIYQLQLKQEELTEENNRLKEELADKRIRVGQAGNIALAALEINNVMQAAQKAADQYLEEIRILRHEAEKARQEALTATEKKAGEISPAPLDPNSELDAILREYMDSPIDGR